LKTKLARSLADNFEVDARLIGAGVEYRYIVDHIINANEMIDHDPISRRKKVERRLAAEDRKALKKPDALGS